MKGKTVCFVLRVVAAAIFLWADCPIVKAMDRSGRAIPLCGVVEGFYGNPWARQGRLDMLDFLGSQGMNMYIYAPKDDPYHREKWREPYPLSKMAIFQEYIRKAKENKVEFVFAISPGLDLHFAGDQGEADQEALLNKMNALYKLGVRQFAIFFDDISHKDGISQASLLNEVNSRFIHQHVDVKPLVTVPTEYFTEDMVQNGMVKPYTKDFAKTLAKDILVLYTGPGVVCEGISGKDIKLVEKIYDRPVGVWWNYPVSDYLPAKLALGPIHGLSGSAGSQMAALLFNPMEHAFLSRIALATGAYYARSPQKYKEEKAWEATLKKQYGDLYPDMKIFADHSQRMDNSWAHTGRLDAGKMRGHMNELWRAVSLKQESQNQRVTLGDDFKVMNRAAHNLEMLLPDNVKKESQAQLELMSSLAQGGREAVYMIRSVEKKQPALAEYFYKKLVQTKTTLPPQEKVALSEKTATAFLTEATDWYEKQ